jgi:hypothetical protein
LAEYIFLWLERLTGSQEVVGSNPIFSTYDQQFIQDKSMHFA